MRLHPPMSEGEWIKTVQMQERSVSVAQGERTASERFVYKEKLGQGAFGIVFKAQDLDIKRNVAIKKPLQCKTAQDKKEFFDEIFLAGQIEHYGTPSIYDVGLDDTGAPYCIMRYIEGESLRDVIQKLQSGDPKMHALYPFHRRGEIIIQVLCVLEAAHQIGVVHRDIKPENILLSPLGEVMLIDWGIALNLKEHDGKDDFCGTPYYMSPEQISREAIDGRSDLYSLSCVFYELLCLKKVVPRIPSLEQLIEVVSSGSTDIVDAVASPHQSYVPSEYKAIIHRGLSKNREDRFTDSAEMLKRLRKIQSGYIDTICHRTFLKGSIFRYLRWLDKNPYPHVYLSYAVVFFLIFSLIGLGFGLGRI
ncbi:MAG: serine/threonine-protein kinase [Myxococcota bacterium]|nr:serine/threonine-protein kinase [Myxococcota bacterium]